VISKEHSLTDPRFSCDNAHAMMSEVERFVTRLRNPNRMEANPISANKDTPDVQYEMSQAEINSAAIRNRGPGRMLLREAAAVAKGRKILCLVPEGLSVTDTVETLRKFHPSNKRRKKEKEEKKRQRKKSWRLY